MRLGRDLNSEGTYRNSPLLHFADFIAALSRSSTTYRFICLVCCMLCVDIIFAPRCGAADGAARKDLGAGETGRKKFLYIFFKKNAQKRCILYFFVVLCKRRGIPTTIAEPSKNG